MRRRQDPLLSQETILWLQTTSGNRAVQRLLAQRAKAARPADPTGVRRLPATSEQLPAGSSLETRRRLFFIVSIVAAIIDWAKVKFGGREAKAC